MLYETGGNDDNHRKNHTMRNDNAGIYLKK